MGKLAEKLKAGSRKLAEETKKHQYIEQRLAAKAELEMVQHSAAKAQCEKLEGSLGEARAKIKSLECKRGELMPQS